MRKAFLVSVVLGLSVVARPAAGAGLVFGPGSGLSFSPDQNPAHVDLKLTNADPAGAANWSDLHVTFAAGTTLVDAAGPAGSSCGTLGAGNPNESGCGALNVPPGGQVVIHYDFSGAYPANGGATVDVRRADGTTSLANHVNGPATATPASCTAGQTCTQPGASCHSGGVCDGSNSRCKDPMTTCNGTGSTCTMKANCTATGSDCKSGAHCSGARDTCEGPTTSCTGAGSTCTSSASCPEKKPVSDLGIVPPDPPSPDLQIYAERNGSVDIYETFRLINTPSVDILDEMAAATQDGHLKVDINLRSAQKEYGVSGSAFERGCGVDSVCPFLPIAPNAEREVLVKQHFSFDWTYGEMSVTTLTASAGPNDPTTPDTETLKVPVAAPRSAPENPAKQNPAKQLAELLFAGSTENGYDRPRKKARDASAAALAANDPLRLVRVKSVGVGVLRVDGSANAAGIKQRFCFWLKDVEGDFVKRAADHGKCDNPVLIPAKIVGHPDARGTVKWKLQMKGHLKPGKYVEYAGGTNYEGISETAIKRLYHGNRKAFACPAIGAC